MKIGILSKYWPPASTDGIPRTRSLLAAGYAALGHEVHVFTSGNTFQSDSYEGYNLHKIPSPKESIVFFPGQTYVNEMLTYSKCVHEAIQHLGGSNLLDIIDTPLWEIEGFATSTEIPEIPIVIRLDTTTKSSYIINNIPIDSKIDFANRLEVLFLNNAKGILANSNSVIEETAKLYNYDFSSKFIKVCYYGIPLPKIKEKPDNINPIILTVGRLEKRKGIPELLKMIPKVLDKYPNTEFIIVGKDNSNNDGFFRETQMTYPEYFASENKNISEKVKFLGYVNEESLEDKYSNADIVLLPSIFESFGMTYIEAMSYGKPVVAFDSGSASEVIKNNETGVLVEKGNVDDLAETVLEILKDNNRRDEMGVKARIHVENNFSVENMINTSLEFYRRCLE